MPSFLKVFISVFIIAFLLSLFPQKVFAQYCGPLNCSTQCSGRSYYPYNCDPESDYGNCCTAVTCTSCGGGTCSGTGCNWGSWGSCDSFGYQARWCSCESTVYQIQSCAAPTPTPGPTGNPSPTTTPEPGTPYCSISLSPGSVVIPIDSTRLFTTSVVPYNGTIQRVNFSSTNTSIASVTPASDNSNPYETTANGKAVGTVTIRANGIMSGNVACTDTATLTVGAPTCTVDLVPNGPSVSEGVTKLLTANVTPQNGTVSEVRFLSSSTSIATVDPSTPGDTVSPYETDATGVNDGAATITARVYMNGVGGIVCSGTETLTVTDPGPWWQARDADVVTSGNLISPIPPGLGESLIQLGAGGYPGVSVYGGATADFESGSGTGTVSSTGWLANSSFVSQKAFSYDYFEGLIPGDVIINEITTTSVDQAFLNGGTPSGDGYRWYRFDGTTGSTSGSDLTISDSDGLINLGANKVILLIKGANLNINSRVNVTNGLGTFVTIVDGDILVDPNAGTTGGVDLEGMYFAEGQFKTGAGTTQLHIRGAVAAYGGVALERNLVDDSTTPAELFEYGLDQVLLYPSSLSVRKIRWKEVAP